jgi:cytochrome b6-f complex iron-sulfur subunit
MDPEENSLGHSKHGKEDENPRAVSRRAFLLVLGWGSFISAMAVAAFGSVRCLIPDVLYEPSSQFKADKPEAYPEGIVKLIAEENVFVDHDENGIFAVDARCTHLGCRVEWVEDENEYHCPCHGAKFHRNGDNFDGPAPEPLPRFSVTLAKDGRLFVDKDSVVDQDFRLKV